MARVLIVEDDESLRVSIAKIVGRLGHSVCTCATATEAFDRFGAQAYELVVTDFRLPDFDGLEILARARHQQPDAEVILLTGFGSIPLAVQAIKQGAYDFIAKPVKRADLERVVTRALEKQALSSENRSLRRQIDGQGGSVLDRIVGRSEALCQVLRIVEQVAPSTATVLIQGASGTGKELVADALHALSPRREHPLVKVNCGAIPETLIEAELFGAERGAYTGAAGRREGRFAAADGGTLFLDEVGTLSPAIQVKLLRALQDGTFEPLGTNRTLQADCRVIAATNVDLPQAVAEGRFREDLYFRLNVITIQVPPLRQRREDIPLLAGHFLARYAARNHKAIEGMTVAAERALEAYDWPGNVRELQHAIERAVVLTIDRQVGVEQLPEPVRAAAGGSAGDAPATIAVPIGTPLEEIERLVISRTLASTGGNKVKAAAMLGISPRTIHRKKVPGTSAGG